jgi:hypothetical protein
VTGEWRRQHKGELHNLYASLNIVRAIKIRRMRHVERIACTVQMRNAYKVLVGKPRPRRRWEDNIKMDTAV